MSIYGKLTVGSKLLRVISQLLIMSKLYNVIFFFGLCLYVFVFSLSVFIISFPHSSTTTISPLVSRSC